METGSPPDSAHHENIPAISTGRNEKDARPDTTATPDSTAAEKESSAETQKPSKKRVDPLKKIIICSGIGLIILIGLVITTSTLNTEKYYLRASDGALEVWKGTFSPAGKRRLVIMPGVKPPESIKPVYSRTEVFPLICEYYIDKSDALIHVPGLPDFAGIKMYLNRALSHATNEELRQMARVRLNRIDRLTLFYKADVAASKSSVADLERALVFLDEAAQLDPDEIEAELIEKKKQAIRELLENTDVE